MRTTPLLVAGFVALLLNSAYLAGFPAATLLYYTNVALHPLLGLGLVVLAGPAILRYLRSGPRGLCATVLLAASVVTGLTLVAVGATVAHASIVTAHVVGAAAGALCLGVDVWRWARTRHRSWVPAACVAVVLLASTAAIVARSGREAARREAYRIENPLDPPASMTAEGRGPVSPFFPSSADTNVKGTIPSNFFMTSQMCGRCHRDIYDQWNSSAHHFSSFNNQWYRKSIEYMQDVTGLGLRCRRNTVLLD